MAKVSIGMPVYNGEKYISLAVDSIISQTFGDFELIISDNASTDATEEICRDYAKKDMRVIYYRNETNLGAAQNYNRLFELSRGEYFKWASHDDICAPDFLDQCVKTLERKSEMVLCYPKTVLIDEDGAELERYNNKMDIRFERPEDRLRHIFQNLWLCNCVFGLIRSSALKATRLIGGYPGSDVILLCELSLLGQFLEIPDHLFFRRIHPDMSRKANTTNEAVAGWFDPANDGKPVMLKCRYFFEYLRAVNHSRLTSSQKTACYKVVMDEWFRKYWRHMGGECKIFLRYRLGLHKQNKYSTM